MIIARRLYTFKFALFAMLFINIHHRLGRGERFRVVGSVRCRPSFVVGRRPSSFSFVGHRPSVVRRRPPSSAVRRPSVRRRSVVGRRCGPMSSVGRQSVDVRRLFCQPSVVVCFRRPPSSPVRRPSVVGVVRLLSASAVLCRRFPLFVVVRRRPSSMFVLVRRRHRCLYLRPSLSSIVVSLRPQLSVVVVNIRPPLSVVLCFPSVARRSPSSVRRRLSVVVHPSFAVARCLQSSVVARRRPSSHVRRRPSVRPSFAVVRCLQSSVVRSSVVRRRPFSLSVRLCPSSSSSVRRLPLSVVVPPSSLFVIRCRSSSSVVYRISFLYTGRLYVARRFPSVTIRSFL